MKKYRDHYFKRAKQESYPARSVYKLQEMDKRFQLLAKGQRVLDLGAAPGSWSMYAAKRVGDDGRVLGVDLSEPSVSASANLAFIQADAFEDDPELLGLMDETGPFDLVLSDMAPKTTGVKFADQARSLELCRRALELAGKRLKPGGSLVVKIFEGPDFKEFTDEMRAAFAKVKTFKPKSSRAESKEMFVLGLGFRPQDG